MLIKNKQQFTLFEVLISLALLSGLLVIIFGFFRDLSAINQQTQKTVKESFQKYYTESRLMHLFTNILSDKDQRKDFFFFTLDDESSPHRSVLFSFNNGTCEDSEFSGSVLARLFVDFDHKLCLAYWPIQTNKKESTADVQSKMKMEYLLENVSAIKFKFFSPPSIENSIIEESQSNDKPPKGDWLLEWLKKYDEVPAIIQMTVTIKKDINARLSEGAEESFFFVLPSSKHPITFIQSS